MSGLGVSPDDLVRAGLQLQAIAEDLRLGRLRREADRRVGLGSSSVEGALVSFSEEWRSAMRVLEGEVDQTGGALLEAGWAYADLDGAVARSLGWL